MGMITSKIEVSKKVGNAREKVGEVAIYIPDLAEFGIEAASKPDDDGLPVYESPALNWLWGAVYNSTKMQARNRLQPASATLKDGAVIATTMAELMAESERGGNAEYLKAITALKARFAGWVATLGKSQKAQDTLKTLFKSREALALQSVENKNKFATYIADFAATLGEDELAAGQRYLQNLLDAAAKEDAEGDDF